jgi:flavin-dependent dehydrogenase
MKNFDVAVIGGGIAGLVATNDLARAGKSVVVLEKSSRLGGRAMTVKNNGACFNLGVHAIYKGGAAEEIFPGFGYPTRGRISFRKRIGPMEQQGYPADEIHFVSKPNVVRQNRALPHACQNR